MIRVRKATIEDVAYIAEGIYHAFLLEDEALYNQWIRTLKEVCAQEDTHYSYRNTWIATSNSPFSCGYILSLCSR